jgi:hypothetical protein
MAGFVVRCSAKRFPKRFEKSMPLYKTVAPTTISAKTAAINHGFFHTGAVIDSSAEGTGCVNAAILGGFKYAPVLFNSDFWEGLFDVFGFSDIACPQDLHLVVVRPFGILLRSMVYVLLQYRQVILLSHDFESVVSECVCFSEMVCWHALHFTVDTFSGILLLSIVYALLQ